MLYALRGTPFIYQGEELGLPDAQIPPDRVVDVDGRDPERAPIPWTPERPATASPRGEPWLPFVDGRRDASTPQTQDERPGLDAAPHASRSRAARREPGAA